MSASVPVRVLSFNICLGGTSVDIGKVAEAIRMSGADVVGLQEAGPNVELLARLVGWAHHDDHHQVLSRWPIAEPSGSGGAYVYVHVTPTAVVAIANVHLPAYPYGPYLLRDGRSIDDVLELERMTRLAALRRRRDAWTSLLDRDVPLVVTGDFNAPAHTDWGPAWNEHRTTSMPWPVSEELAALGFADTYRVANPSRAGLTWTYGYPHPHGAAGEPRDRIDFVWVGGPGTVVESTLVGPSGVPDVEIQTDPWPSDHLAVVSAMELSAIEPSPYVAARRRRIEVGDPLTVRFAAPGAPGDRIGVVSAGGSIDEASMWVAPMEVERFGEVVFGTVPLAPGAYDVVLVSDDGELGRSRIWLVAPGERPSITATLDRGSLSVAWRAADGRRFDWIGVYAPGDPDLANGAVAAAETGATIEGTHVFDGLDGGNYTIRLMGDSSIAVLAEATVTAS